jgi:hypothetical protein
MRSYADIEYYIHTGRGRVVDTWSGSLSIEEILDIEDVYIKYFLLTHLRLCLAEADTELAHRLRLFLRELRLARKIVKADFDVRMLGLIRENISFRRVDGCIGCLSELEIGAIDLEHYRKYFGYAEIYKHYRHVAKTIFSCRYSWKEIGITMLLLNNEGLCFRRLLPLFSRLTMYVKKDILDRNIVACCIALRAALAFLPGRFLGRDEYIASLISYLSMLLSNHTTFAFINEKDADTIIGTIEALSKFGFAMSIEKICIGIFRRLLFNIENIVRSSSTVYEEIFAVICSLEILCHIHRLIMRTREVPYEFSKVFYELQEFNISKMEHISLKEWSHIEERYLAAKYRLLDAIYGTEDVSLDRIIVYNDISRIRHPSAILCAIDRMKGEMLWSDLIVAACSGGKQEEYILFLFDDFFMEQIEHLTYIELYIDAAGNSPDLLLYSGYLLTRAARLPDVRKRWEILASLYFKDINSLDQRLVRLREIIAHYVAELESSGPKSMFLEIVLDRLAERQPEYNPSAVFLLDAMCQSFSELLPETAHRSKAYLRRCFVAELEKKRRQKVLELIPVSKEAQSTAHSLPSQADPAEVKSASVGDLQRGVKKMAIDEGRKKATEELRGGTHEEGPLEADIGAIYVCVAARYLVLSETEMSLEAAADELYFELLVACVSYKNGRYSKAYYERICMQMFKFLFQAERWQIEELGPLVDEGPHRDREGRYLALYRKLYGNGLP